MLPKFEGKFGIPGSHEKKSELTVALYRLYNKVHKNEDGSEYTVEVTPEDVENQLKELTTDLMVKGFFLSSEQKQTLHLKLARHFEKNTELENKQSIIDAIIETPRFVNEIEGDFSKLLNIHHVKMLQKIAENRKILAMKENSKELNPYENLYETSSGNFYMARLISKEHLIQESEELTHCVGTSDHYFTAIVKGDTEIFSFRDKVKDSPLFTIEYDRKSNHIVQIKGQNDIGPSWKEWPELLEAVELLDSTFDDAGKQRHVDKSIIDGLKFLKKIEEGVEIDEALTKEELAVLYTDSLKDFNSRSKDVTDRVLDIIKKRDVRADMAVVCGCDVSRVATKSSEFTVDTDFFYNNPVDSKTFIYSGHFLRVQVLTPEQKKKLKELVKVRDALQQAQIEQKIDPFRDFLQTIPVNKSDVEHFGSWNELNTFVQENKRSYFTGIGNDSVFSKAPLSLEGTFLHKHSFDLLALYNEDIILSDQDKKELYIQAINSAGYRPLELSEFLAILLLRQDNKDLGMYTLFDNIASLKGFLYEGKYMMPHCQSLSDAYDYFRDDGFKPLDSKSESNPALLFVRKDV